MRRNVQAGTGQRKRRKDSVPVLHKLCMKHWMIWGRKINLLHIYIASTLSEGLTMVELWDQYFILFYCKQPLATKHQTVCARCLIMFHKCYNNPYVQKHQISPSAF